MPSGTGHFTGSSKRVEAHSKSSNLVVNLVALSRDLPVFTGFFELIRVVFIIVNLSPGVRAKKNRKPFQDFLLGGTAGGRQIVQLSKREITY